MRKNTGTNKYWIICYRLVPDCTQRWPGRKQQMCSYVLALQIEFIGRISDFVTVNLMHFQWIKEGEVTFSQASVCLQGKTGVGLPLDRDPSPFQLETPQRPSRPRPPLDRDLHMSNGGHSSGQYASYNAFLVRSMCLITSTLLLWCHQNTM